jgi:hypothetical protein
MTEDRGQKADTSRMGEIIEDGLSFVALAKKEGLSGYQKIRQWISGYRSIRIKGNGYSVAVHLGMAYAIALLVS